MLRTFIAALKAHGGKEAVKKKAPRPGALAEAPRGEPRQKGRAGEIRLLTANRP
jgi:hypothetical protein